jgi:hypothetical protein
MIKSQDLYEDDDTAELIRCCAECYSPDAHEVSAGDEGWTICPDCQSVEQGYVYLTEAELDKRG